MNADPTTMCGRGFMAALMLAALAADCSGQDDSRAQEAQTDQRTDTTAPAAASQAGNPPATAAQARIVLLHHSTGECIWNGGVPGWFEAYNAAHATRYAIVERAFPKDSPYGWENYPYDYWNIWVRNAGDKPFKQEPTLEILTKSHDVIVLKHCFPVSNIDADTGEADVASSDKRLENYRLQYAALKKKMREFPKVKFVVWTGAAQVAGDTDADQAGRGRQFADWVRNTWDEKGDNIFVWDFRTLETDGGLYIKPANAAGDAHPNETFSKKVAPLLGRRIVDVIQGRGDTGDVQGGKIDAAPPLAPKPDTAPTSSTQPLPPPPPTSPGVAIVPTPTKPGRWVFDDAENPEAAKRLWSAAAGYVEDGGANVIAVRFAQGREEDWGEYGVQRIVETRPPQKNHDIAAFRYLALRIRTDRNMEIVVKLVTRPDPAGPASQSQFAFTGYLHPEAGSWKTYTLDLTKLELGAEGDTAHAAAGKPARPMHLTMLALVTNKKNEAAKVLLDDITFYRELPENLQGTLVQP